VRSLGRKGVPNPTLDLGVLDKTAKTLFPLQQGLYLFSAKAGLEELLGPSGRLKSSHVPQNNHSVGA
jgi:hypothetical protein